MPRGVGIVRQIPVFFQHTINFSRMNTSLHEQVLALHRHYNQVAELQQAIPSTRPRHGNYAAQEQQVMNKAREVLQAAQQLPVVGTGYASEVDNIVEGCRIMQFDPYKKLGGIRRV